MEDDRKIRLLHDWVRDMPFESDDSSRTYQEKILHVLKRKRGSCSAKHYFLGLLLENLGVNVTYLTYPFYWRDLNVAYPARLRKLTRGMPIQYHLAIEVKVSGKRTFLDATWDSRLTGAGFIINEVENAKNAVVPCGEYLSHYSMPARDEEMDKYITELEKDADVVREFYSLLDQWLEEIRHK